MNLSIIIPNFNGLDLLKKNLSKVVDISKGAEIIVVDDASTDKSVEFLHKEFPDVKVCEKKKNEGFASTVNLGVRHASHEYTFLLNSDCIPENGAIEKVLSDFKDNSQFAVGFAQKSIEKGETIIRGRGLGKFEKGFFYHSYGEPNKNTTQWVSGGAGIFRKSIWQKLGGMDEIYNPFYWEDIDLSYRAIKSGYTIGFDPDAFVVHSQSKGSIRTHYTEKQVEIISLRNQFLFVWLNISDMSLLLNHVVWIYILLFKAILTTNFSFVKAYLWAQTKLIKVIEERVRRRVMWKKNDKECFI